MAAVSTFPSGPDYGSQSMPKEHGSWEYAGQDSQEVCSQISKILSLCVTQRDHKDSANVPSVEHHGVKVPLIFTETDMPLMIQNQGGSFAKAFSSRSQSSLRRKADPIPLSTQQTNGNVRPPSDPTQRELGERTVRDGTPNSTKTIPNIDASYLSPYKGGRFRPALSDKSRSGSEADSLIDLYGHPRSTFESTDRPEREPTLERLYNEEDDPESSRWIHRDKLAVIESQEMQEAGIKLPRPKTSKSNLRHRKSHSRNRSATSTRDLEPDATISREEKRLKTRSPEQQEVRENDPTSYDLRTPEEIASDPFPGSASPMYNHNGLKSSTSRIPLPNSSPMPIPREHIERHTPLPRKRGTSGDWSGGDEYGFAYNKIRSRSSSAGSRVLLNEGEMNGTPQHPTPVTYPGNSSSSDASPSKVRIVSKSGSVSNARPKTANGPRNVSESQKPRIVSSNQRSPTSGQSPKSRSGLEARPATAVNRPEGDPPWIATMYKPDPRLPPDQQILPTHAKRLEQEQRERESKAGQTPPQNRAEQKPQINQTPLTTSSSNNNPRLHQPNDNSYFTPNEKQPRDWAPGNGNGGTTPSSPWPLKMSPSKSSLPNGNSPTGSGIDHHGGYSTIPKVQSTPPMGSAPSPKPMPQPMVQEKPKPQKEKGCGCCVVM